MGYGIIQVTNNKPILITMGVLLLDKYDDHFVRIKKIFERVISLIDEYHPDELAIEAPFFGKNIQSMLKLGRAQGAAIAAALSRSMPIFEYAPKKIKMSITGMGASSKEQVAAFLKTILKFDDIPKNLDATDGLAAALCHFYQGSVIVGEKSAAKNWKSFIAKNPGRVSG